MPIELPEMPPRITALPLSERGYPVPWFVAWMKDGEECEPGDGAPDFRVIGRGRIALAWNKGRCWICGQPLGSHRVYPIGPMCVVNRVTSEPPSHRDCAEFAAKACPFMTNPREKRSEKGLPEDRFVAGEAINRNPGAVCLYETSKASPFKAGAGVLFQLGPPAQVDWYARGRRATRAEIEESIRTGYPILRTMADKDGPGAVLQLNRMLGEAMKLLPEAA